jgi:protein-tyrosine phosphatase
MAPVPAFQESAQGQPAKAVTDLHVPMEQVHNTRDLGGLVAFGGARIKPGRLYRSGNPAGASAADVTCLQAMKLDAIVDFRSNAEKSQAEVVFGDLFQWVAQPVFDADFSMEGVMQMLKGKPPEAMETFMAQIYRDFVGRSQPSFAGFLKLVEGNRTLLYHCTAGKDRTGFATMLLLSALGVDDPTITANYLESNVWNHRFNERALVIADNAGIDAAVVRPLLEVREDYLDAARAVIDRQYGGIERYLRETLQVDIDLLRRSYLDGFA